jgi:hypothetical protein
MSRPKKHTREVHLFLTLEQDGWLEARCEEEGRGKSDFIRNLLAREMGSETSSVKPATRGNIKDGFFIRRREPWERLGIAEDAWMKIPADERRRLLETAKD